MYVTENPNVLEAISRRCFSEIFRNFTDLSVAKNYHARPNVTELLAHAFLKKLSKQNLIELLQPIHAVVGSTSDRCL